MYKQINNPYTNTLINVIKRIADNACIPFDPANTDYIAYLKFLEEGGQPLPADDNGQTS
jgi:hypothetical protein